MKMKKEIKQTNNQKNISVRREKNAKKKYNEKQKTIKNGLFFKQDQRKDKKERIKERKNEGNTSTLLSIL